MDLRLLVFTHAGQLVGEVADIIELTRIEEINGEHSLTLVTREDYEKQQRMLFRDSQNVWHEYVIIGIDHTHADTNLKTYYAIWSIQYDLDGTIVTTMPGRENPVTSTVALQHALAGTARWTVGNVTQNTTGGASMYYLSGWEALGKVVEVWGGEVDVTIEAGASGNITSRRVNLLNHQGSSEAVRRFDYSSDLQQIRKIVEDTPFTCRITPRGAAEESELGGYGRKITIESVNSGIEWLQDDDVVDLVKLPDGQGGWEYPNQIVEYSDIDDPQILKEIALAHLHDFTRPRVTYEAEVIQLEKAGLNAKGIGLGDVVNVVDRDFTSEGLRLEGRVTRLDLDELDPANNQVTIGFKPAGLPGQFDHLNAEIRAINNWIDVQTTPEYVSDLIERINTEINATGGYTYLVEGVGIITYDVAVTDPAVGAEATQAVEIRGGTVRIADSKDAQGNWEWRTVFTAGHIAGEVVTAAQITTGYIGSAGSTYIDLDNNTVQLGGDEDGMTITSERISFMSNGEEVAYIVDDMLYIQNGEFLMRLRIGNFEFRPRSTGNLSFVYVGSES